MLHGSSPHSPVRWDLGQGGAAGRTFAPGATDLRAATAYFTPELSELLLDLSDFPNLVKTSNEQTNKQTNNWRDHNTS